MMGTRDWLKSRRRWDRRRATGTLGARSTGLLLPKLRPRRASVRFTRPVDCSVHVVQSHTLDTGVIPQKIHRHFYLPTPNRDGPFLHPPFQGGLGCKPGEDSQTRSGPESPTLPRAGEWNHGGVRREVSKKLSFSKLGESSPAPRAL
jgi:hypothetical protein